VTWVVDASVIARLVTRDARLARGAAAIVDVALSE